MIDSDTFPSKIAAEQRSALTALRRFARAEGTAGKPVEKCELCSMPLPAEHQHLIDLRTRRLTCCCQACVLLFSGGQNGAYRRVPQTIQYLPDFRLSDAQWDGLLVPINLAFFYRTEGKEGEKGKEDGRKGDSGKTGGRVIAVYPSPAGPVESLLELDAWQGIVDDNPRLRRLQPEVEALLVNRLSGGHFYYVVPIDQCYRLSGLIRLNWRGLSGGSEVWEEVGWFFQWLKEQSCST